ncbi:hypothetical protein [Pseudomonas oryzihabitans]|uniref:hypothetical protein n=1 Tax=Pseudomonas oryzihabitans TaxID=47885 RepID=UPI0011201A76|nr:hypothetical protein [Pseudomonas psychrotolerans]
MNEDQIYLNISELLFSIAPSDVAAIKMSAALSPETGSCKLEYDAVRPDGSVFWLVGGGEVNSKMLDLLVGLRRIYLDRNSDCLKCIAELDVVKGKIKVDFLYS